MFRRLANELYNGNAEQVAALVSQALADKTSPATILNDGLLKGMEVVGRDFKAGDLFIPEVLAAARAMHAGMQVLQPLLTRSQAQPLGHIVIGTVEGDLHDIGKNLVGMMMEGAGVQVTDLGTNVPAEKFVDIVREKRPQIIGFSALLTTTMTHMRLAIQALEKAGLREDIKIMVGGAPVTQTFATDIGADGYAPDAVSAVDLAKAWLKSAVLQPD